MTGHYDKQGETEFIRVKSSMVDYVLRITPIVVLIVMTYAVLWLKVNAPTRDEFNNLSRTVQGLRDDLLLRQDQGRQIDGHEGRIRTLERTLDRMFPQRKD